nr:hypothetical protein [Pseudomonadota bacterium]
MASESLKPPACGSSDNSSLSASALVKELLAEQSRRQTTTVLSPLRPVALMLLSILLIPCTAIGMSSPLPEGVRLSSVSAGGLQSCAVSVQGRLYCWGIVDYRWLDFNWREKHWVKNESGPVSVDEETDWKQVSVGDGHTCAIKTDGRLYCWGYGEGGVLGLGDVYDQRTPGLVAPEIKWVQVDSSKNHSCAVSIGGELYCWGFGYYGQLGSDDLHELRVPTRVGTDAGWKQVSAGYQHTCAVKTDKRVYCWGRGKFGALGSDSTDDRSEPVLVDNDADWDQVSAGAFHTCAVKTDGGLYCWGSGIDGRLGQGDDK